MWRLPTIAEWQALSDAYPSSCVPSLPGASGTGCYSTSPWATGVQSSSYWSSSSYVSSPSAAWYVFLDGGFVDFDNKTLTAYVWPVRGGP